MTDGLNLVLSSPLFYILLILLVMIIAFRSQVGRLIDRITEAQGKVTKDGVGGRIKATPNEVSPKLESLGSNTGTGNVTMRDVMLDNASEIETIDGNVEMDNIVLDKKSRIGKIKG